MNYTRYFYQGTLLLMDCLELVDHGSNTFLADLASINSNFNQTFTSNMQGWLDSEGRIDKTAFGRGEGEMLVLVVFSSNDLLFKWAW